MKTKPTFSFTLLLLATGLATAAWADDPQTANKAEPAKKAKPKGSVARAVLVPTAGSTVKGTVSFVQKGAKVLVTADVEGLKPDAKHGFHIHEFGDCSAVDGKSAGGHFNPTKHPHAGPDAKKRHGGDLGNLQADAAGKAHLELEIKGVTVKPGKRSVVGRGLIVHADEDDLKTQPTGNAGARAACGVVGHGNPG